jgi:hypothetical protein
MIFCWINTYNIKNAAHFGQHKELDQEINTCMQNGMYQLQESAGCMRKVLEETQ